MGSLLDYMQDTLVDIDYYCWMGEEEEGGGASSGNRGG